MCLREFKLLDGTCLQAKNCETYTHGENNTAHAYRCKIGINLYRPLEFRIIFCSKFIYILDLLKVLCDLNYEGWLKSNVTDVIVLVARKKNPIKFHCIYTLACLLYTRCSWNHSVTKGQFFTKDRSIASNKQSTTHETVSVYITSLANVTYRRYNVHWWSFKY